MTFESHKHLRSFLREETKGEAPAAPSLPCLGKYSLLREVGRGGVATVYEARDPDLNRAVALKVLSEPDPSAIDRFHREATLAAKLNHPQIISVHEVGVAQTASGPVHYISMDFVEGTTLDGLIRGRSVELKELVGLIEQVAWAVQYAHERGVVHRDLKPSNVLINARREPILTDFGLAKSYSGKFSLTLSGTLMGTPAYMSPEQARGSQSDVGERSDVYALGVILYEAATGVVPFDGRNMMEVCRKILEVEPPLPRNLNPEIDRDLEIIILKALQKEPSRRYPSARDLASDLRRFLNGESIVARYPSWTYRAYKKVRKNWPLYSLGLGTLVAAMSGLFVWALKVREQNRLLEELNKRILLPADEFRPTPGTASILEKNLERLETAVEMLPPDSGARMTRGVWRILNAEFMLLLRQDPRKEIEAAVEDLEWTRVNGARTTRDSPHNLKFHLGLARCWHAGYGLARIRRGERILEEVVRVGEQAIGDLDEAVRLRSVESWWAPRLRRTQVRQILAECSWLCGERAKGERWLEEARGDLVFLNRSMEGAGPWAVEIGLVLAWSEVLQARVSPTGALDLVRSASTRLDSMRPELMQDIAAWHFIRAECAYLAGEKPRAAELARFAVTLMPAWEPEWRHLR